MMALPAGSFSLHHTLCRHRSAPNRAAHRRVGIGISYIPAHCRLTGSVRMCARLARGSDRGGHFDLIPVPEGELHPAALARHEAVYRRYRENYAEQIAAHERELATAPSLNHVSGRTSAFVACRICFHWPPMPACVAPVSGGYVQTARLAETETHILCLRPASNRQPFKYSSGLAGGAREVEISGRDRIDFGGRSRTFLTFAGIFQNRKLCGLCGAERNIVSTQDIGSSVILQTQAGL